MINENGATSKNGDASLTRTKAIAFFCVRWEALHSTMVPTTFLWPCHSRLGQRLSQNCYSAKIKPCFVYDISTVVLRRWSSYAPQQCGTGKLTGAWITFTQLPHLRFSQPREAAVQTGSRRPKTGSGAG
uniref:Uncharacterized protein n=1 Tax=Schistocephalus solidus TaxID=70667 RepID=A0A0X3NU38_SCHSO